MSLPRKKSKKIELSIIIPTFNQAATLLKLLQRVSRTTNRNWEVIVIDDASKEDIRSVAKDFSVKFHRFNNHRGPAKARNKGAEIARGNIFAFLDADTLPYKDSLHQAHKILKKNPDIQALSGIWDIRQKSKSFFPNYKALRDWSYYFYEKDEDGTYFFNTRAAMIRSRIFKKTGGFLTKYKKADLESLEFSFRLIKLCKIHFSRKFLVKHQFPDAITITKNYFKRTYYFLDLYKKYGYFGKVVSTKSEAENAILAALLFLLMCLSIIFGTGIYIFLLLFSFYIFRQRKFIKFFYKKKGLLFTLYGFIFNYFLHLVIVSAVISYFLSHPLMFVRFTKNAFLKANI